MNLINNPYCPNMTRFVFRALYEARVFLIRFLHYLDPFALFAMFGNLQCSAPQTEGRTHSSS